jgi:hypothetical protein
LRVAFDQASRHTPLTPGVEIVDGNYDALVAPVRIRFSVNVIENACLIALPLSF